MCLLAGCKNEPNNSYTIGFSQCTGADEWRKAMIKGMQRELAFHPNVTLLYRDAQYNNQKQIEQIRELANSDIDLLIVSPNEDQPITPIVEEVFQKGIPVVVVDRRITSPFYTAYVGGNNYEVGKIAGEYINTLLKGKGKIIEITGSPKSTPAIDRHKAFMEVMAISPDIEVISINGEWEKQFAKPAFLKIIDQHPDADLIFGHNDRMTVGAYEVMKEKNLLGKVKFVGIDGLAGPDGGIDMVNKGVFEASVIYSPGGEEAIQKAIEILQTGKTNKETILHTAVIDSSNVRMMKMQTDKILSQQDDIEKQQKRIDDQIKIYNNQQVFLYVMSGMLVVTVVLGSLALYSLRENQKINRELKTKNQEILEQRNKVQEMAEKAQEATETKFRFFTNISHEFRTPLTLILAPVEELLAAKKSQATILKKDLQLIHKNALRLLRQVNQLMDFRKIESGKIRLKASQHDLIAFLRDIQLPFEGMAKKRHIDFQIITSLNSLPLWFDADMLDKVFFNLLSNAFKFTGDKGRIYVYVEQDSARNIAIIRVEDTGVGMSAEESKRAFEMFYQGQNAYAKGTGLGLPLSQEFVELHQGKISVQSKKYKGTCFTVELPLGKDHFSGEEISAEKESFLPEQLYLKEECKEEKADLMPGTVPVHEREYTILVIEDNEDLTVFLKERLQENYEVITAADGNQGMKEAFEQIPDLIICDIMLPDTDGLKVTSILKSDLRTSHIPVILLTARNTVEQQIEGMHTGADLYLTKPFSLQFLQESIRSLLMNRAILKNHYMGDVLPNPKASAPINKLDKKFISDFKAIIETRLAEPSLNVDSLCKDLGLSRIQLYRKVKAVLGVAVNDYIQTIRLNKACHHLQQPGVSVADVAYQVGFSSPTYFSTAFKAKYGVSPIEYKNQKYTPQE
ncbi:substrate-binding domain-containing protein [Rhodocytophaga rosea]|uniref:histidine kinase n=2 Tax=Rhodocytophaga rosea TaxID=2704465 RepID=A0A6C0GVT7_9BACT|nr:substrate-binding domain-containing protein [Rhodocytophaga rosea]